MKLIKVSSSLFSLCCFSITVYTRKWFLYKILRNAQCLSAIYHSQFCAYKSPSAMVTDRVELSKIPAPNIHLISYTRRRRDARVIRRLVGSGEEKDSAGKTRLSLNRQVIKKRCIKKGRVPILAFNEDIATIETRRQNVKKEKLTSEEKTRCKSEM